MPRLLVLVVVLAAVASTGCGGSSSPTTSAPPVVTSSAVATPCAGATPALPAGPRKPLSWEQEAPAGMPKPPGIVVTDSTVGSDGVHIVRAISATSLRTATLFIVRQFPPAGFVLGRGDAEATESDAPFQHGDVHGLVRLLWTGGCETQWLIATANTQGGSPLLPPSSSTSSPSPLPFG